MPLIARSITNGDNDDRVFSETAEFSITRNLGKFFTEAESLSLLDTGDR
jgi:hypothetical protein